MPYLSSYKLEEVCDNKQKLFFVIESLSLVMKLAAILMLIIVIKYFYIAIALWVLSIAVGLFRRNLIYKYVYIIDNGVLIIKKEYNTEKFSIVKEINIATDISEINNDECERKYYEHTPNMPITVVMKSGEKFSLSVDAYFCGLIDYYRRQYDLS